MKQKKTLVCALLILLTACATSKNYDAKLNSELGKTSQQLINNYGQPSKIKKLANGDKIISYISINYQPLPTSDAFFNSDFVTEDEIFYPFTYGETEIPIDNQMDNITKDYCKTDFYITNNIVTSWQWRGNACVAL